MGKVKETRLEMANFARFLIIVSSFYLVGLCAWHIPHVVAASVKYRILGLGLMGAGLIVGSAQRWGEDFPLGAFLILPGIVIASVGMAKYRPGDMKDNTHQKP